MATIKQIQSIPFFSQFSEEQLRQQLKHNAQALRQLERKARTKGRKVNGQTADQWGSDAKRFEQIV